MPKGAALLTVPSVWLKEKIALLNRFGLMVQVSLTEAAWLKNSVPRKARTRS